MAAVAVYFQMVLGGLVRHSGAALACTDVPLCRGALWPDAHPTVLIQVLHRLNALVVAGLVLASSIVTLRRRAARAGLRALAVLAPVLVVRADLRSACCAVVSFLDLATVESHLAVATALLATQVLIVLRGRRVDRARPRRRCARWFREHGPASAKPRITGAGGRSPSRAASGWRPASIAHWRAIMTLIGTALLVAGVEHVQHVPGARRRSR